MPENPPPATGPADADARSDTAPAVSRPLAVLLLGWIGAIKATDAGLATVALVDATRDLQFGPAVETAAASISTLALAATVIATGLAADRLGRRRLLLWAFATSAVASLITLAAPSAPVYLAGRALAGVGLGAVYAASYAYVRAVAPGRGLGWALGLFGMYCSVVAAVASVAGGWLAGYSWRAMYAVVPVMCIVAAVLTPRLLPPMPRVRGGRVDVAGLVLLGAAMVLLLLGASQAARSLTAPLTLGLLAGGIVVGAAWVVVELRVPEPSFPVRLFGSGAFVGATVVGVTVNMDQAAATLQLSDFWQYLAQDSVLVVTAGLQPFYLIGVIGGLVAGRMLSAGVAARPVIVWSCLATGLGFLTLLPLERTSSYALFLPAIVLIGTGMAAAGTAQSKVFVDVAPAQQYGTVTASKTTVGQLGFAVGLAFSTVLVDTLTRGGLVDRLAGEGVRSSAMTQSLDRVQSYLATGQLPTSAHARAVLDAAADSYQSAFRVVMTVSAVVMLLTAVSAWFLMGPSRPEPAGVRSTPGSDADT